MTISQLIKLLQDHGDDGTANIYLSYQQDIGYGDQEMVVDVASIRIEISPDGLLHSIVLVAQ